MPPKTPRPYQEEALANGETIRNRGIPAALYNLATGLGKTLVAVELVKRQYDPRFHRSVFLAPALSLIDQTATAFQDQWPEVTRPVHKQLTRRPGLGVVQGKNDDYTAQVIIGSNQTLIDRVTEKEDLAKIEKSDFIVDRMGNIKLSPNSKRPVLVSKRFDKVLQNGGMIDHLMIDEAHHSPADGTLLIVRRLQRIAALMDRNPMNINGFTATPVRSDGRSLANIFNVIAISRSWRFGQENGYLVPFADPKRVLAQVGQYQDQNELVLMVSNWADMIVDGWEQEGGNRRTISAVSGIGDLGAIETCKILTDRFNERGHRSFHVNGEYIVDEKGVTHPTSNRLKFFKKLSQGYYRNMVVYGVGLEGLDIPEIECLIWARMAQNMSPTLFPQAVGRILRLSPETGKKDALILDFTGNPIVLKESASLMGYKVDPEDPAKPLIKMTEEEIAEEDEMEQLLDGADLNTLQREFDLTGNRLLVITAKVLSHVDSDWFLDDSTVSASLSINATNTLYIHPPDIPNVRVPKRLIEEAEARLQGKSTDIQKFKDMSEKDLRKYIEFLKWCVVLFSNWTLWHIRDGQLARKSWIAIDADAPGLETKALVYADQEIPEHIDVFKKKGSSWKYDVPSERSLNYLRSLMPEDSFTRLMAKPLSERKQGKVAKLIDHYICRQAVDVIIGRAQRGLDEIS